MCQKNCLKIKDLWEYVKPLYSFYHPISYKIIKKLRKKKSGCYLILNEITGEIYIGSTCSGKTHDLFLQTRYALGQRYKNHFIKKVKTNKNLRKSIEKHGVEHFSFHILKFTWGFPAKAEQKFINLIKPSFNVLLSVGFSKGFKHSTKAGKKCEKILRKVTKDLIEVLLV